ncbi:oocyte zinc finger protein XlCOF19-like isoform X2 [Synchiropus splendidus]|nr:oocyte zinc finger protein XlCOF19-like isoform X2 [Synchiropus splendidus]XP_053710327.1 oocyte zinc finger protein XlCOF19-like isoform X2 [Synchiropus splendidus]
MKEEEDATEQQECSSSLDQEGQDLSLLKEEKDVEDKIKEEATQFSLTVVKSEYDELGISSSTQQMKTDSYGDECGGPSPASDVETSLHADHQRSLCSESDDTDDSEDWGETSDAQSRSNSEDPARHVSDKNDADPKSPICSEWTRRCSAMSGLTRHVASCCGQGKTCSIRKSYNCSHCGKCFSKAANLKRHMTIHNGEKSFNCSQCCKSFTRKDTLKKHMKFHTGEKPFSCSLCGQSFKERGTLNIHMRIHTGEKPFVCSHCGACFRRRHSFQIHMSVHTGEKPFSCSQCGKCFKHSVSLTRHMKTHGDVKC